PWPPSAVIARSAEWQRVADATVPTGAAVVVEPAEAVAVEAVGAGGDGWVVGEAVELAAAGTVVVAADDRPPPHPAREAAVNPATPTR
ncbi:MAG: hypothetical protein M3256_05490, partial [Actinomycetota bacterium]|nr:hypothetical protein [Actinomycetota bacterium]